MNSAKANEDLDVIVNSLVTIVQMGFDRDLVLQLGRVPGLDLSRAETELRLLDLFGVYVAIKTTDCERWRHTKAALFECVCTRVVTWWAAAWDTKDDVVEVLKGRFAAYDRLVDASGPTDLDTMTLLVGLLCAITIQDNRRTFVDDAAPAQALTNVLIDISENHDLLCGTAAIVFRSRFSAVSELLLTISG